MRNDIEDKVIRILRDVSSTNYIYSGTRMSTLGLDSLDIVEVIMEVEKEFDISIVDDDINRLSYNSNVHDICVLVEKAIGEQISVGMEDASSQPMPTSAEGVQLWNDDVDFITNWQLFSENIDTYKIEEKLRR